MSALNQKTLKKKVKFKGIGLHTGNRVSMTILPSKPDTGIIFKRTDLKNNNIVLPNVYNVSNATLCTTITNEHGVSVSTIEHLMGALYGLGIDNAYIEINSNTWVKKSTNVLGAKTVMELRGIPCIDLETEETKRKSC